MNLRAVFPVWLVNVWLVHSHERQAKERLAWSVVYLFTRIGMVDNIECDEVRSGTNVSVSGYFSPTFEKCSKSRRRLYVGADLCVRPGRTHRCAPTILKSYPV